MRKKMLTLGLVLMMALCLAGTAFAADSPTAVGIDSGSVTGATVTSSTATSVTTTGAASGTQISMMLTNSSAKSGDTVTIYITKANGDVVAVEAVINDEGYAVFTLPAGIEAGDSIVISTVKTADSGTTSGTTTDATSTDNVDTGVETNVLGIGMIVAMLALASGVAVVVKKNI